MPFWHDGVFHLYYLLDENHHQGRGGLGGHQWAHATTRDLRNWMHHPLALAIDEEWEGSICTGSVFYNDGVYHAFYATRKPDWTQHLSHASSSDGVTFQKTRPLPLAPLPAGLDSLHFRDPFARRTKDGRFHLLVTARQKGAAGLQDGGCLYHMESDDVRAWHPAGPFFEPGKWPERECIPECPDWFEWNGWNYLVYGDSLRTRYVRSRSPMGPWERPAVDLVDSPLVAVMKTASFGGKRRIGVGWIGTRADGHDGGPIQWGGHTVFREILQQRDGTLGTAFVREMMPLVGDRLSLTATGNGAGATVGDGGIRLDARQVPATVCLGPVSRDLVLRCKVVCRGQGVFELDPRASAAGNAVHPLRFDPARRCIALADQSIENVAGLDASYTVEIVCTGEIVDVCIGGRRCLINRLPEPIGGALSLSLSAGQLAISGLEVRPIVS